MDMAKGAKQLPMGYILFMALISLWLLPITLAPFLQQSNSEFAAPIYAVYGSSLVCHQLNSRSLCYYPNGNSISDCTDDSAYLESAKTASVAKSSGVGYKFPVCARDIGIYYSMLLGGIAILLLRMQNNSDMPNPWLLALALIPMAIDGTTQAMGMRESSNFLRLITGFLAGIALPFYIIPMLNSVLSGFFSKTKAPENAKQ